MRGSGEESVASSLSEDIGRGTSIHPTKVVILGWFGNGNLGDEIILESMLEDFKKIDPRARFVVISDDPTETELQHGVRSIGRGGGTRRRLRRFLEIMTADLFILGGGGILCSYGGSDQSLTAWLAPLHLAHALGLPTMTWGIGIGDELTIRGGEAMKQILGEADSICVRDQPSAARLGQIGIRKKVTLTADPALLLPEGLPTHVSHHSVNSPPKVFVFVRHWYVSENRIRDLTKWRKFEGSLAACLDSLISERSAEVCFIPMRIKDPVDDDRVVAREISQIMAKGKTVKIVDQTVSSSELVHLIAQGDLIIGMRLHSLITAATMGVPSIAINYHPKVRSFMESIGGGEWVFEIGDPDGSSQLLNAAREVLSGRYPREEVLAEVDKLRALAHLNTSIAAKLLHDDSFARGRFRRVIHAIPILASRTIEAVRKHD